MLQNKDRIKGYDAVGVVLTWAKQCFPEVEDSVLEATFREAGDEEVEWYRLLCKETGRVIEGEKKETKKKPPVAPVPIPTPPMPEDEQSRKMQEEIEFLKFQSEMEQQLGNEAARDERKALSQLEHLAERDAEAYGHNMFGIEELDLVRNSIEEPPGFELSEDMIVTEVLADSPAHHAGLANFIGYRLLTANGQPLDTRECLYPFWAMERFTLGLFNDECPVPPSPPPPPPPPKMPDVPIIQYTNKPFEDGKVPLSLIPGYVFARGFGSSLRFAEQVVEGVAPPSIDQIRVLPVSQYPTGAVLVKMGTETDAEVLAKALHKSQVGSNDVVRAFMVWESRGTPDPKDIVEEVAGHVINITNVVNATPKHHPQVRELEAWVPPTDLEGVSLETETQHQPTQEWDQFTANEALGVKPTTFTDNYYSTKLDTANLTEEQREKALQLAAQIGDSTNDSIQMGLSEEDMHSAVLRADTNVKYQRTSEYLLISGLKGANIGMLYDMAQSFNGAQETKMLDQQGATTQTGVLKMTSKLDAEDFFLSEMNGAAYDDTDDRIELKYLFPRQSDDTTSETIAVLGGVQLTFTAPKVVLRELKAWSGSNGAKPGECLDDNGAIGEWDQFEANRKLGMKESTYNENLYTTDLAPVSIEKQRDAERLATEIGLSTQDSLLPADGEGDGDDEEARHSSVNPGIIPVRPPVDTAPTVTMFFRGFGGLTKSELAQLFQALDATPIHFEILPQYRHPPGAAIARFKKEDAVKAMTLDGTSVGPSILIAKIVFPTKTVDPNAFIEEFEGEMLDLTHV
eukprot:TRINITY_DN9084_c0_g1_i1.p1 TRINITY_DN9084_c0_g1~~TRINITY_DN9084_c0_g1_i1.p1  ORF type:complete len:812 (+),score=204.38 TRINITY_DN9084_c0_g1_i1:44-2437(+)